MTMIHHSLSELSPNIFFVILLLYWVFLAPTLKTLSMMSVIEHKLDLHELPAEIRSVFPSNSHHKISLFKLI